ncbi:hypothetical protein G4H13_03785 [Streptomyces rapamycinicus]|uniref:Uncharacterized protein n=1 Tax=Streptomyces rhizosphaericus TaxID=114699 RepID=A0A6G4A9N9_9ACTN|nr:hypothetical protein [Streptomyces rhizosphaericus]
MRHRRSRILWGDRYGPELNAAAERLASVVREQLGREERLRRLQDPAPIPVRWDTAPQDLMDHWENVTGVTGVTGDGPIDLRGRFEEIADVLDRLPSGRLVVLGPSDTGRRPDRQAAPRWCSTSAPVTARHHCRTPRMALVGRFSPPFPPPSTRRFPVDERMPPLAGP